MPYYPRFENISRDFYATRGRQFENPAEQAEYDRETDELFSQMVSEIIGSGTSEPGSIERALAYQESAGSTGVEGGPYVPGLLNRALGGSRKLGEKEQIPPGSYALAKFPGIEHQIWALEAGFAPRGYRVDPRETSDEFNRRKQDQRKWAATQRSILDMESRNPFIKNWENRMTTGRLKRRGVFGFGR